MFPLFFLLNPVYPVPQNRGALAPRVISKIIVRERCSAFATIIERAYRDPNSNLRILGATTTVAAGINTPASTAIIAEQEFYRRAIWKLCLILSDRQSVGP